MGVNKTALDQQSEKEQIRSLRFGGPDENECIRWLIRENQGKIQAFVFRNGGTKEDFEEVFQHGITDLVLNVRSEKFRGESSIHTYLFAICKGLWYKLFKKRIRENSYIENSFRETEFTEMITPEDDLISDDLKQRLDEVLLRLKDKCNKVLILWAKKYSMTEVAKLAGYTNSQVAMNKKNKCLKELRLLLSEYPQVREEFKNWFHG